MLEAEADRDGEGVHDAGQGRTLLGHLHEHLARPAVLVLADGHVALAVGHPERERARRPPAGQPLPDRLLDHDGLALEGLLQLGHLQGQLGVVGLAGRSWWIAGAAFLAVASGWATLQLSR